MRMRQVQLEFHMAPCIADIGTRFDAAAFARAYKDAGAESVTLFAKCLYGLSYHPTGIGQMHPGLKFDLLGAQIAALKAEGVATIVHLTAVWDELAAARHPEWRIAPPCSEDVDPNWSLMDLASAYRDYFVSQVMEVLQLYPHVDGIAVDTSSQAQFLAQRARDILPAGMDRQRETGEGLLFAAVANAVSAFDPAMPLYMRVVQGDALRYARGAERSVQSTRPAIDATSSPSTLLFQCAERLADGVPCLIEAPLAPPGAPAKSAMAAMALAFDWVAARQQWSSGTMEHAQVGVLAAASLPAVEGARQVLSNARFSFAMLDVDADFRPYDLLILPDDIAVDAVLRDRINAFVAAGGRVLLTGRSGIDPQSGFVFDLGARWDGPSDKRSGDYLLLAPRFRSEGSDDPIFMPLPSEPISLHDGVSLGEIFEPHFDMARSYLRAGRPVPHRDHPSGHAAGVTHGNFTYVAHPIFTCYHKADNTTLLAIAGQIIAEALDKRRSADAALPRGGRVIHREQPSQNRSILHLLYGPGPGQGLVPLNDIAVQIQSDRAVTSVRTLPDGHALAFSQSAKAVTFVAPEIFGNAMIELKYSWVAQHRLLDRQSAGLVENSPTMRRHRAAACPRRFGVARTANTVASAITPI